MWNKTFIAAGGGGTRIEKQQKPQQQEKEEQQTLLVPTTNNNNEDDEGKMKSTLAFSSSTEASSKQSILTQRSSSFQSYSPVNYENKNDEDDDDTKTRRTNNNHYMNLCRYVGITNNKQKNQQVRRLMIRKMFQELLYSIVTFKVCWDAPRYIIYHDQSIPSKVCPYQEIVMGADQRSIIIYDFALNHPLMEPPTIPSKLLVWTSVYIPMMVVIIITFLFHPYEEEFIKLTNCNRSTNNNNERTISENHNHNEDDDVILSKQSSSSSYQNLLRYYKVCNALGNILLTIGCCESMTHVFKYIIQRKRPNYYALCQMNESTKLCTNPNISEIIEAQLSFPSGHSSLASCSMIYVTWFIIAKLWMYYSILFYRYHLTKQQQPSCSCCPMMLQRTYLTILILTLLPGWAMFVGATRIIDKWHHPSDVVAGLVLGSTFATVMYHIFYPSPLLLLMNHHQQQEYLYTGNNYNKNTMIAISIPWLALSTPYEIQPNQDHQPTMTTTSPSANNPV